MLKKIFAVFFAGMFFVAGAGAAVDERKECVKSASEDGFFDYGGAGYMVPDYAIFFDNDSSDIPTDCTSEVDKLVALLKNKRDDIETVLLIGSADSTGNSQYNAELAQNRVNTVNKLLQDADVPLCEFDEDLDLKGRCARVSIGESDMWTDDNDSRYKSRAVFMFVIYKGDICDEKTIEALDALIKVLPDDSSLKQAQEICNSNKKDQMLLRSQRQQIMAAMADAIANYPEKTKTVVEKLPADLSATILANGIIAVRDSLVRGASVWKTDKGTFNYARLASDSIAGVVLGTAGGIITSNVVKKNQIKSGFDDVMCTVGGQSVANWGDEFRVGVR
ncbi:MAG: OmpA family protein [Alphaproteobacteria bacterium]|nr:OmpA family protein [Alphaproteobacteria bacterium]